ncbi:hypothetical protein ACJMK2_036606 [Sinanodonta woodiana]|uniref:Uncharacterized protein n=1 Tax=Sinanodonta woodiana TaxID=1069815 RepID=A0ABD3WHQ5_SINWO
MTGMAGKRKYEYFIICVSVIAKCGKSNKKICNNRILEYSTECTWDDVYHDITNDTDFRPHKADVLNVNLHEGLHVVKEFNQGLKYVTFTVTSDENVGLDDVSSTTTSTENQQAPPARTAFSVLMSTSMATKLPHLKDTNAEHFTVQVLVNALWYTRLQLSCAVHIEFPYYASNIGRPDICAHCGAIGAEKSQEMTGRFRTVLPVCQQCLASGKDIPKRNPVKK